MTRGGTSTGEGIFAAWDRIKPKIRAEIGRARRAGKPWTKYRPFLHDAEKVGKARCGICRKPATQVSYSTILAGATVCCDRHAGGN